MKTKTFLLTGTNLGERKKNLADARTAIELSVGSIIKSSSIFETAAWGKTDQPDFLNQALEVETLLDAKSVLLEILKIEQAMGRKRSEKWGERIMDIDILLFGSQILEDVNLVIPHPQLGNRKFALEPLAEIAGDMIHPVLKIKIKEMLEQCSDSLLVQKID